MLMMEKARAIKEPSDNKKTARNGGKYYIIIYISATVETNPHARQTCFLSQQ